VGFVVDKVALEQVWFSTVSIIPPLLHIHSCLIWEIHSGPVSGYATRDKSHPITTMKIISLDRYQYLSYSIFNVFGFFVHYSGTFSYELLKLIRSIYFIQ
jgi:hypothetical protein